MALVFFFVIRQYKFMLGCHVVISTIVIGIDNATVARRPRWRRYDRDVSVSTHSYRLFKYLSAYSVAITPKVLSTMYVHAYRSTSEITLSLLDKVLFNIIIFFVTLPYWPSAAIRAEIFTDKNFLYLL